jgi:hypothetical protein
VLAETDVLYVTRVQKERFEDLDVYESVKGAFVITPETMKGARQDMVLMHRCRASAKSRWTWITIPCRLFSPDGIWFVRAHGTAGDGTGQSLTPSLGPPPFAQHANRGGPSGESHSHELL